jgi:protein-tyrosine-phosphatase
MAEALLGDLLTRRGVDATVSSAGLVSNGQPATDTAIETMAERGLDITEHRSRRLSSGLLASSDLVIGMTREHVREAAVLRPDLYDRTYTLKELVRRGLQQGARAEGEQVGAWLGRLHRGRDPRQHLGASELDDVADPVGQGSRVYGQTADELADLTRALADLLWPGVRADVSA